MDFTTQSLKNTALRWLTLLSPSSSESPGQAADGPFATSTALRILWQLMQASGTVRGRFPVVRAGLALGN